MVSVVLIVLVVAPIVVCIICSVLIFKRIKQRSLDESSIDPEPARPSESLSLHIETEGDSDDSSEGIAVSSLQPAHGFFSLFGLVKATKSKTKKKKKITAKEVAIKIQKISKKKKAAKKKRKELFEAWHNVLMEREKHRKARMDRNYLIMIPSAS